MATNDKDPRSVMSRGKGDGHVVNGARSVKHHRWASVSSHRDIWPGNPNEAMDLAKSAARRQKKKRTIVHKTREADGNANVLSPGTKST